ncbi:hypothetical protein D3C85_1011720 [compost metagenome]
MDVPFVGRPASSGCLRVLRAASRWSATVRFLGRAATAAGASLAPGDGVGASKSIMLDSVTAVAIAGTDWTPGREVAAT